jgi:hypothetical protein
LCLYEAQAHGSGANYVALRAPTSLSANTTYTLPASAPATSAAWLQSDNTGAMSWRPVFYGTVSVDPPNIAANTSTTFTVTITGVQPGDLVFLTPPSGIEGGLVFQGANVTAADQVTIRMRNDEENAQLRQRVSDLETENAALRARLERLETLMQRIASTQTNP